VVGAPRWRNPETLEPIVTTIEARVSSHAKKHAPSAPAKSAKSKSGAKSRPVPAEERSAARDEQHAERATKHDRVLELLSQRNGASIPEMMDATGWQQHSVRGFLAGTVKKKHGFTLTSSKAEGELRRYRIDTKRGR
jgi:hypothetical protein